MRLLLLGVVVAAVAGCTKPNPASCSDNHCSDPALPFCDVDGTIGGEPNTCIAVACTAGEFAECRGDAALTCNAAGTSYDLLECEFGCGETGCKPPPPCTTPECEKHIIPKYLPTICDTLASEAALDITADTTLDTEGSGCTSVVTQTSAPEICVLHYGTITIERNVTYRATGSRVLALVADRDLLLDGVLDISSKSVAPGVGPGGNFKSSGVAPSGTNGGGGAGNRTPGAAGASSVSGGGPAGGAMELGPVGFTFLVGGPHGSSSGGGGGVTLVSCRAEVLVPGLIDAGGMGGQASGTDANFNYKPAHGGASGGNVILQGMKVTVTGELYANGGAGGGGGGSISVLGGQDGQRSTAAAAGGQGDNNARGGNGGALGVAPAVGQAPTTSAGGGGGGGSTGWLVSFTPSGVMPMLTPTAASPAFEQPGTVPTN